MTKFSKFFCLLILCVLVAPIMELHAGVVSDALKGKLTVYHEHQLQPFIDSKLGDVKLFAFYYSAHWCPPCQAFTPQLVQFYNRIKKQHPEFELVFFSDDHSIAEMTEYMHVMKMPWPAFEFHKKSLMKKYCGPGIPCLVVVDENGKVLADSFENKKYVGPKKVMDSLGKLLAGNPSSRPPETSADFDAFFKKKPAN